jgi:hypothetical protein
MRLRDRNGAQALFAGIRFFERELGVLTAVPGHFRAFTACFMLRKADDGNGFKLSLAVMYIGCNSYADKKIKHNQYIQAKSFHLLQSNEKRSFHLRYKIYFFRDY